MKWYLDWSNPQQFFWGKLCLNNESLNVFWFSRILQSTRFKQHDAFLNCSLVFGAQEKNTIDGSKFVLFCHIVTIIRTILQVIFVFFLIYFPLFWEFHEKTRNFSQTIRWSSNFAPKSCFYKVLTANTWKIRN